MELISGPLLTYCAGFQQPKKRQHPFCRLSAKGTRCGDSPTTQPWSKSCWAWTSASSLNCPSRNSKGRVDVTANGFGGAGSSNFKHAFLWRCGKCDPTSRVSFDSDQRVKIADAMPTTRGMPPNSSSSDANAFLHICSPFLEAAHWHTGLRYFFFFSFPPLLKGGSLAMHGVVTGDMKFFCGWSTNIWWNAQSTINQTKLVCSKELNKSATKQPCF